MTTSQPTPPVEQQTGDAQVDAMNADQAALEERNAAEGNPTPTLSATQEAMLNEDWTKLPTWDVTDAAGQPVTTLDALVQVLGMENRAAAARELLASPAMAAAPAELLAEAEAEGNPDQGDLLEQWIGPDGEPGLPPAGGLDEDIDGESDAAERMGAAPVEEDDDPAAKAFPWQKGKDKDSADTGSSTRKATIAAGAFVSGNFGKGKVEVVVTNGKVPGVDTDIEGTKDSPACRVQVYEETDGDWKASGKKIGVKASGLKTIPPLGKAKFGKKSGAAGLVLLVAEAKALPADQQPTAEAIRTVYERGLRAWPEGKTILQAEEWALGRAQAFVHLAQGIGTEGYVGDNDLLPS